MALRIAAIVPHTPILLTARDDVALAPHTIEALRHLNEAIIFSDVDVVARISPHGVSLQKAAVLNVADTYHGDLEQFGDLQTSFNVRGIPALAQRLTERLAHLVPIQQVTDAELDFGVTIPMLFLPSTREKQFLVVHPPLDDYELAFELGNALRDTLDQESSRVLLCASADLSMRHSKHSPAGYSPRSQTFDAFVRQCFEEKTFGKLLTLEADVIEEAGTCGFATLLTLAGALHGIHNIETIVSSYEVCESTGLLTAGYALHTP